ncbi:MAG: FecR domain-containing protein [Prevotella sp.]|nr:FecR domain-containing protein [Prevotella sp.]
MQNIQNKIAGKNYRDYSFEDFLNDEFFISSVRQPTEESRAFWRKFIRENGDNLQSYNSARLCVESVPVSGDSLSDKEITDIWAGVNTRKSARLGSLSRRLYVAGASVAAVVALALVAVFLNRGNAVEQDIYAFAGQFQAAGMNSGDVQLVLSEDRLVTIRDRESEITYGTTGVQVKGEAVSAERVTGYNQLTVPNGKRSVLTFSEGTRVWVNAGSRVVYPVEFSEREREIYVDGEIYLEVSPDSNRPFSVKTKDIGVRVLGTAFNVTARESDSVRRVVLVSGSVKISVHGEKGEISLSPDRMYEHNKGENRITDVDVYKYISWKDGMYLFKNERLGDILERLSAYYGINIEYDGMSGDLRCSGKLDLKSELKDVLTGLTYTAPVLFHSENGRYAIKYSP